MPNKFNEVLLIEGCEMFVQTSGISLEKYKIQPRQCPRYLN